MEWARDALKCCLVVVLNARVAWQRFIGSTLSVQIVEHDRSFC
jgi:general stress protein CsbA